jgi:outer membrane protein
MEMRMTRNKSALVLACALFLISHAAFAGQPDDLPKPDLDIRVDAGAISAPAFLGSKNYQVAAVPNITVKYSDKFFASLQDGVGYNIVNDNGWRIGPLAKYALARGDNGDNPLKIAGDKTNALRGLGNVDGTVELGGFIEYTWMGLSIETELRQGVNGHNGLINDINVTYTKDIHSMFYNADYPLIISLNPHATIVDSSYNEAYFGVNASQSVHSGLPRYTADGGLLSYGFGMNLTVPLNKNISLTWTSDYTRVAGDAGNSPLVKLRGSESQWTLGASLSYSFHLNL